MLRTLLSFILLILVFGSIHAQPVFLGFDQEPCGILKDHGYTYRNDWKCANHGTGYQIFREGVLVYQTCSQYEGKGVVKLVFINDSTGFMIEQNSSAGHCVLKTTDSGRSWKMLNTGAPVFLGSFLINAYNMYLITATHQGGLVITRASDIRNKMAYSYTYSSGEKTILNRDTIYGESWCGDDTLTFRIKSGNDTLTYIFAMTFMELPTSSLVLPEGEVRVFPNPATNRITVDFGGQSGVGRLELYTSRGQLVMRERVSGGGTVSVQYLERGLYLYKLQLQGAIHTGKIVLRPSAF